MPFARRAALLVPFVLASSVAFADDPPGTPAPSAAAPPASSTAASSSALPPNAPIVLSPGVPATPSPKPIERAEHPAERRVERKWFGYQTLIADIAIVGTAAALLRSFDEDVHLPIFLGASALYLGAGPLIHLANKSGEATGSLFVRSIALGAGTLGGAILISGFAGCTEATPCKLELVDFAAMGAGVGAMIGAVVDAGWYAWKVTPTTTAYVRPTFTSARGGGMLGLTVAY